MRFLRRHFLSLSLLLLAAVAVINWVWSMGMWRIYDLSTPAGRIFVVTENARLMVQLGYPPGVLTNLGASPGFWTDIAFKEDSGASERLTPFPADYPKLLRYKHPAIGLSLPFWQVVLLLLASFFAVLAFERRRVGRHGSTEGLEPRDDVE